ncbi:hypothetical protein OSB04_017094 [Centaurea solstitialis]|uniref:Uncharacterized protein n=1 Tax=Centaurea solstitialis TaxID=347529 RepID=A0AA38T2A0_9ASTR|nr:hypothetical protein OSB04_017094 [Centaurea solstitialis]
MSLALGWLQDARASEGVIVEMASRYWEATNVGALGQPRLGLWYPYESPFELLAYTDSDYDGASLDRKSTSGGCQFLGARLVSWQCKKQTTVSTSTAEAEYVAAAQCCSQVLWIQNQMLDYGIIFLNTPVYIDNNSAISIVLKVYTNYQYADLFTKAFDVGRFKFLITITTSGVLIVARFITVAGIISVASIIIAASLITAASSFPLLDYCCLFLGFVVTTSL